MQELCRKIRAVDISTVLATLGQVEFVRANRGSTNAERAPCWVNAPGRALPGLITRFVWGLGLGGIRRVMLRKLGAREGMPLHIDRWMPAEANWRRIQVPLVSHPDIKMRWPMDRYEEHLEPGFMYEVRFDRYHEVVNPTDTERIHLQIDHVGEPI